MKYSKEILTADKTPKKFLMFWGNQPSKDGSITKSCLSQWWEAAFTADGVEYKSAEHYMMAKKAELFNDTEIMEKIISCKSPAEAKKLGREVKNYDEEQWLKCRFEIVVKGNYYKFSQNQSLKDFLLNTGNRVIVEASPVDAIWGIGLAADNPDCYNPEKWRGDNLLGFALMEVRDLLEDRR
ncbi:DUF1768 domain-containing protein [Flavobacterium sp. Sd200]|uniref:NADAR family protein n=1 Tax=Flavobacterium sp. Sd200 TaxID=2692211 RepID=UPI001369C730|nr:NADAR family protein [Flavobacterium sp. Sd200]MXN92831.1 DUF1768 domain-containing protein [Flavobacterium sp. Sd200]